LTTINPTPGKPAGESGEEGPSHADLLLDVMSTEADARRQRYFKRRLQLAYL
jgi:hypothetical protein